MDSELISLLPLLLPFAALIALITLLIGLVVKLSERVKALETHLDIIRKNLDAVEDALPYIEIMKANFVNVAGQLLPKDGLDDLIKLIKEKDHR